MELVFLNKPIWMWGAFATIVSLLLAFDLGVLQRKAHIPSFKESVLLSSAYITIALLYGGWIHNYIGAESGKEYFTGFVIEKALSLDNIFVMYLIFSYLQIPLKYQHRVLFWGILGVVVLRGIMIAIGATLVSNFHWVLYIFAVFLIYSGMHMLISKPRTSDMESNPMLNFVHRFLPVSNHLGGQRFWSTELDAEGKPHRVVTPLMVALILIEISDLIFAVDSVPAIFSITQDPFIVYTSNIFAILGLRALYFVVVSIIVLSIVFPNKQGREQTHSTR